MAKAVSSSLNIRTSSEQFIEENLLSFSVANYSENGMFFTYNGIERYLPPADPVLKVPVTSFDVDMFGNEFDAKITFRFLGPTGNCIVEYSKLKTC